MRLLQSPLNLLLAAGLLAALAGATPSDSPKKRLESHLIKQKDNWQRPCGQGQTNKSQPEVAQLAITNLRTQVMRTLVELRHRREESSHNTSWSSDARKQTFRFLRPFVTRETGILARLSMYWASLELVSNITKDEEMRHIVSEKDQTAVDDVRGGIKQLLCHMHIYMQINNKTMGPPTNPTCMQPLVNALINIDPNEIKIHIWYTMCRLECFLTNMKWFVRRLNGKSKGKLNPLRCKVCPYEHGRWQRSRKMQRENKRQQANQQGQPHQQPKQNNQRRTTGKPRNSKTTKQHKAQKRTIQRR